MWHSNKLTNSKSCFYHKKSVNFTKKKLFLYLRFEVFRAVKILIVGILVMTLCSPAGGYHHFGGSETLKMEMIGSFGNSLQGHMMSLPGRPQSKCSFVSTQDTTMLNRLLYLNHATSPTNSSSLRV